MVDKESELEQKTRQYENFPGHILGLDGWMLRSIPQDRRKEFLTGYERILKIVFHPDRSQNSQEKKRRESYLQSVSEAVQFLTSDQTAFDLTVDTVGAAINPIVGLRKTLQGRDDMVERLKQDLDSLRAQKEEVEKLYQRNRTDLAGLRKKNSQLYSLMQQKDRFKELNMVHLNLHSLNAPYLSLKGRYISFGKEVTDFITWMSDLDLSHITSQEYSNQVKEFCRLLEKDHLSETEEHIELDKRQLRKNPDEIVMVMGVLPFEGMLQYLAVNYRTQNDPEKSPIRNNEAALLLGQLNLTEKIEFRGNREYESQKGAGYASLLRPYIVPRIGLNMPVVLRRLVIKEKSRKGRKGPIYYKEQTDTYKLLYLNEMKTRPR